MMPGLSPATPAANVPCRRDQPFFEFARVFAEIPDVPFRVLREPVERVLRDHAIDHDEVPHFDASDAVDHPRVVCH